VFGVAFAKDETVERRRGEVRGAVFFPAPFLPRPFHALICLQQDDRRAKTTKRQSGGGDKTALDANATARR